MIAARRADARRAPLSNRAVNVWVIVLALLAIGVALRGSGRDPLAPWTGVGVAVAASLLFAAMAWWRQHEAWGCAFRMATSWW